MCPIFGSRDDISLFRNINRELLNKMIQQEVAVYKLALNETAANLYGESDKKVYYAPVKVIALVGRDVQTYRNDEIGQDYNNKVTVSFLRDDLVAIDLFPEVGDILLYDNEYLEIDTLVENKHIVGKNPDTVISDEVKNWGSSWSMIYECHITSRTRLNITDSRPTPHKE